MPVRPSEVLAKHEFDDLMVRTPGHALTAKFRIDGILGTGGMGVVVAAHHLALDQRVALKLMRPELRDRKDLVRRFVREARVAARLKSGHTARVLDVGLLEDGAPYIVMECLDGEDLASYLRRTGSMSPQRAAGIVLQALDAIVEAHALGVVHRDLKPANLFLAGGAQVKVLDLGICKLVGESGDTAHEIGTPVYMAPEQLCSAPHSDARSDVWSVGVILHELVTGTVPFRGHTLAEVRSRLSLDGYPGIGRDDVPEAFENIVRRCLAMEPAARFQTAAELADALTPLAEVRAVANPRARSHRRLPMLAAFAAAALGAIGIVAAIHWLPESTKTPHHEAPPRPVVAPVTAPTLVPVAKGEPEESVRPVIVPAKRDAKRTNRPSRRTVHDPLATPD